MHSQKEQKTTTAPCQNKKMKETKKKGRKEGKEIHTSH